MDWQQVSSKGKKLKLDMLLAACQADFFVRFQNHRARRDWRFWLFINAKGKPSAVQRQQIIFIKFVAANIGPIIIPNDIFEIQNASSNS